MKKPNKQQEVMVAKITLDLCPKCKGQSPESIKHCYFCKGYGIVAVRESNEADLTRE